MQIYITTLEQENLILKNQIVVLEGIKETKIVGSRNNSAKIRKGKVYRSNDFHQEREE